MPHVFGICHILYYDVILLCELLGYFCMFMVIYVKNRDCSAHMKMPLTCIGLGEGKPILGINESESQLFEKVTPINRRQKLPLAEKQNGK